MTQKRTVWDDRYDSDAYVFGTEPNDFLAAQRRLIPSEPVLCIGDGEGRNGNPAACSSWSPTRPPRSGAEPVDRRIPT